MLLKDFEFNDPDRPVGRGRKWNRYADLVQDKYMIIYQGDHVMFFKKGVEKTSWNKKGYTVTYDSCNCQGFKMSRRKGKDCRHITMLKTLGWELKENPPEKDDNDSPSLNRLNWFNLLNFPKRLTRARGLCYFIYIEVKRTIHRKGPV